MESLVGRTLNDRYQVRQFIGQGGMAQVYLAWDIQRATALALKMLHEDLAMDQVFLRRFEREASVLARLQHPNIVRFYGLERDENLAFMLVDYIDGQSLQGEIFKLQGQIMPMARMVEIMRQTCSALYFAHQNGFVHCDVKPANILVEKNGRILVSDFGIARLADSSTMTMAGMGTPAYMAPEQILGKEATPQTDIYALGIMLYEMLSGGERPFTGEMSTESGTSHMKVCWEHLHLNPPPLRRFYREISPALDQVVMCCLEKDPVRRFANTLDLKNALLSACGMASEFTPAQALPLSPVRPQPPEASPVARQTPPGPATWPASNTPNPVSPAAAPAEPPEAGGPYQTRLTDSPPGAPGAVPQTVKMDVTPLPPARTGTERQPPEQARATGSATIAVDGGDARRQPRARSRWLWAGSGLGLLVIAVIIGFLSLRAGRGANPTTPAPTSQAVLAIATATQDTAATHAVQTKAAQATQIQAQQVEATNVAQSTQATRMATGTTQATKTAQEDQHATQQVIQARYLQPLGLYLTPQLRLKPANGSLAHDPADGAIEAYDVKTVLKNFVLEVSFENPGDGSKEAWDYGVTFRRTGMTSQYRMVIQSNKNWILLVRDNQDSSHKVSGGTLENFNQAKGKQNTLRLIVNDARGWLYVNGEKVAELVLDAKMSTGEILLGTGYYDEISGAVTRFKNLTVWALP